LVGGDLGAISLSGSGSGDPLVLFGKVYFSLPQGLTCVDLYTGETLWVKPGAGCNAAQLAIPTPRAGTTEVYSQDVEAYIWDFSQTTTGSAGVVSVRAYKRYNAFTGELDMTIPNALLSPSTFSGLVGWDPLRGIAYIVQRGRPTTTERNPAGFLIKWDSNMPGVTKDWSNGIIWNVTAPAGTGNNPLVDPSVPEVVTLLNYHTRNIGYSTETGEVLWEYPINYYGYTAFAVGDGKAYIHEDATRVTRAYDLRTGNLAWESEPTDYPWGAFMSYTPGVAYGQYYALYYDGLYAFDTATGNINWKFSAGETSETPYGTWSFYLGPTIADGKVFAGNSEHSPTNPRYRGSRFWAIDATTGEEVWSILGAMDPNAVAYGYLIADNEYDGKTYCFGKGPTETTVNASPKISNWGTNVLIEGTVTDQSPGLEDTPAISDEYMTEWMDYKYMQQPCPMILEGVEVKLETLDPNNNFYEIGTVTSDASGMFKLMWEPPVPGEYTIIATFEGSESYFSSYAETAIGVTEAPSPAGPIEPEPTEPTEAPLISTEIAIIIAAVILAVAVFAGFWILKKRK
jgi:hypothetical protein